MKTKNNLENKAAFFAQYWDQKVWITNENDYHYSVGVSLDVNSVEETDFLELTPLSHISDEDALYIASKKVRTCGGNPEDYIQHVKSIVRTDDLFPIFYGIGDYDFLRSRGYAIPFRELSVNDLIEYNWIKLKK